MVRWQRRHVGQNRKQEDSATTLEGGNDRWILCQLEFFYARALSQERDFWFTEFNHLQSVASKTMHYGPVFLICKNFLSEIAD